MRTFVVVEEVVEVVGASGRLVTFVAVYWPSVVAVAFVLVAAFVLVVAHIANILDTFAR